MFAGEVALLAFRSLHRRARVSRIAEAVGVLVSHYRQVGATLVWAG